MNVIELVKKLTEEHFESEGLSDEIHIDFTEDDGSIENLGIFSIGDVKVGEDILGNETRRNSIVMFLVKEASEDETRATNMSFLLNMADKFDNIQEEKYDVEIGKDDNTKTGKLKSIACSNAMLYGRKSETDYPVYQIQMQVTYKLYN